MKPDGVIHRLTSPWEATGKVRKEQAGESTAQMRPLCSPSTLIEGGIGLRDIDLSPPFSPYSSLCGSTRAYGRKQRYPGGEPCLTLF